MESYRITKQSELPVPVPWQWERRLGGSLDHAAALPLPGCTCSSRQRRSMAITPPGGMPLASGCVLVLALIDAVYGTCTPATITVNGQRLLIGSTNPASTNAVAEGTSHCPSVCRDNECATLGGVYLKGAYMCCSGAFKLVRPCVGISRVACGTAADMARGIAGAIFLALVIIWNLAPCGVPMG